MKAVPHPSHAALTAESIGRIDLACDRYEASWRGGQVPDMETCLAGLDTPEQLVAIKYLIPLEVEFLRLRGKQVDVDQYARRFPELSGSWIRRLLSEPPPDGQSSSSGSAGEPLSSLLPLESIVGTHALADYELAGEIARGGMGVVYKAKQKRLNRWVALKMMHFHPTSATGEIQRFMLEAEAAASLDHPNIVPIYEVGQWQTESQLPCIPYIAMKLISGGTLAASIAEGKWQTGGKEETMRAGHLLATLARAVNHAHQHGILHRDIKPANILIDREGHPYIADFGLAKRLADTADNALASEQTHSQVLVGTPSYMAPEQIAVGEKRLTTAADVYALGAVLYELVTGKPPFQGNSVLETIELVSHREVVAPAKINPAVPRDLETIILKCLDKVPERRYAGADALADDLDRFLQGEPVQARPVSALTRTAKWIKRRPALAALLGALLLVTLTGFIGITWQWRYAVAMQHRLEEQKLAMADSLRNQQTLGLASSIASVQRSLSENNIGLALAECEAIPPEMRHFEHHYLKAECHERMSVLVENVRPVLAVDYNSTTLGVAAGSEDGKLFHYSLATGKTHVARLGGSIRSVAFSDNGQYIAALTQRVHVYDIQQQQVIATLGNANAHRIDCAAISPDGTQIVLGHRDTAGTITLWDVARGKQTGSFAGHPGGVRSLSFHRGGNHFASAGNDAKVIYWNLKNRKEIFSHDAVAPVGTLRCAESGRGIFCVTDAPQSSLMVWSIPQRRHRVTLAVSSWPLTGVTSLSKFRLAVSDGGGTIRIFNTQDFYRESELRGHRGAVTGVAGDPESERIVSAGVDGTVRLWTLHEEDETRVRLDRSVAPSAIAFAPSGSTLAIGTEAGFSAFDLIKGTTRSVFALEGTTALAFSPRTNRGAAVTREFDTGRGQWMARVRVVRNLFYPSGAASSSDGGVTRHSARVGATAMVPLPSTSARMDTVAFSENGRWIVGAIVDDAAGEDPRVDLVVIDAVSGEIKRRLRGRGGVPVDLKFGDPHPWLACCTQEGAIHLWNTDTWQHHLTLDPKPAIATLRALAFHPRRPWIAAAGNDGSVRTWDLQTGREMHQFEPHATSLRSIAFHPDGNRLVGVGDDGQARWWDVSTGLSIMSLLADSQGASTVTWSADGNRIAVGGASGSINLWEGKPQQPDPVPYGANAQQEE